MSVGTVLRRWIHAIVHARAVRRCSKVGHVMHDGERRWRRDYQRRLFVLQAHCERCGDWYVVVTVGGLGPSSHTTIPTENFR